MGMATMRSAAARKPTMTQTEPIGSPGDPKPQPEGASSSADDRSAVEGWLGRLKLAVGLKTSGSIRDDLAEALATGAITTGDFSPEERTMLANILRLREVRVDDVMVPRADIEGVEIGTTLGE